MEIKVGMGAKCLSHTYGNDEHFTVGHYYEITAVDDPYGFYVTTNVGTSVYCLINNCAHGEWEIMEEE